MSPVTADILSILETKGYLGNDIELKGGIDELKERLDSEVHEVLGAVDYGVNYEHLLTCSLGFDVRDRVSGLDISLDFSYLYLESMGRFGCTGLTAITGIANKNYKIKSNHDLPSFRQVAEDLQQKLQLSPFMREAERMIESMENKGYRHLTHSSSDTSFLEITKQRISEYAQNAEDGITKLLSLPGSYQFSEHLMQYVITLELNRESAICHVNKIEADYMGTKMLLLPGKNHYFEAPFDMLSTITDKYKLAKANKVLQWKTNTLPTGIEKKNRRP